MVKYLCRRALDKFSQRYNYNVDYMRQILSQSLVAFIRFNLLKLMSGYRVGVPVSPWFAGVIRAVVHEDCGPCVQLMVDMALEAGVDPATVGAIVSGSFELLPSDVGLVARFAELTLAHDPEADKLRARIIDLWGQRGLISLGFAISASRVYPTLKYIMGHGQACSRVQIKEQSVIAMPPEPEAVI